MRPSPKRWRVWTSLSGLLLIAVVLMMRPASGHSVLTLLKSLVLGDLGSSVQEQSPLPPSVDVAGPSAAGGVQLTDLTARYSKTDLVIQTSIGPLSLTRTFQTIPGVVLEPWGYYQPQPQWFWQGINGSAYFDTRGGGYQEIGCPSNCTFPRHADYVIQDPDTGTLVTFYTPAFDGGVPYPVNGYQVAADIANPARLYLTVAGGNILQYELIKENVHYYFDGGTHGLEDRIEDTQGRTLATISAVAGNGVSSIVTADGTTVSFENANGLTQVLSVTPPGGTLSQVATYTLSGTLYTNVQYTATGTGETYAYGTISNAFTVTTLTGEQLVSYVVDAGPQFQGGGNGLVTQQTTEDATLAIAWPIPVNCPLGIWACENETFTNSNAPLGDGTWSGTTLTTTYTLTAPDAGQQTHVNFQWRTGALTNSFTGASPTTTWQFVPGSVAGTAGQAGGVPPNAQWRLTPNGAYTVYPDAGIAGAVPPDAGLVVEYPGVAAGATSSSGAGALSNVARTYVYGANYQQLISTTRQTSPLGTVTTYYNWDLVNNRLNSVVRVGMTAVDSSFGLVSETIGTIYTYNTGAPAGRIAEVDGPCFITGSPTAPTGCATSSPYPKTKYTYYGAGGSSNSNQLYQTTVCTSTSCSAGATALTTAYSNYDTRGRWTTSVDANGVTTTLTYQGDHLVEKDVNTDKTLYTYDGDFVRLIQEPSGMYELTCYRVSPSDSACSTGGTATKFVQWKARCSTSNCAANSIVAKVVYAYQRGILVSESYFDGSASATPRRVVRHDKDPLGRATFEGVGSSGDSADTSHAAFAAFDNDGNQIAAAFPYNGSTPFCSHGTDTTCSIMSYDRLDRLQTLSEPLVRGQASQETFNFDTLSHISSIAYGDLTVTYQYDDFGNLLKVNAPWLSGAAQVQYAYDAQGHITYKHSPSMATGEYLQYTYDSAGRPTALNHFLGGTTTLWSLAYDTSILTPPANCPGGGAASFIFGRAQVRTDSFGQTWYTYNFRGQVTGESRIRAGSSTCAPLSTNFCPTVNGGEANPNTSYIYALTGQLSQINYPHGRSVKLYYGAGGDAELVDHVSAGLISGSTCTETTLLANVTWEPFGGLRGYQINAPVSSTQGAVEYLLGDNSTVATMTSCPAGSRPSSSSSDQSGRLRALWVSSGAYSPSSPTGTGNIFARQYSWQGDQLTSQATCLLQTSGIPLTENFFGTNQGYNTRMRLEHATRPALGKTNTGGAWGERDYTYTPRGARNAETTDCWNWSDSVSDANDQLTTRSVTNAFCSPSCIGTPTFATTNYTYDADGRVATITSPADSVGPPLNLSFNASIDGQAAVGSVYKAITVNDSGSPLTYEYWYDANGQRRLKVYPDGEQDEYFYGLNNEMLEDHENCPTCGTNTIDQYVWLAGRPVILLRGSLNSSDSLNPDFAGSCADLGTCGVYFPVTDYLGKPVALVDSSLLVAGAADYDPFGQVNRVVGLGDTPHPYSAAPSAQVVAGFRQTVPAGATYTVMARARFYMVDTDSSTSAYGSLTDLSVAPLQKYPSGTPGNVGGPHFGATVSDWAYVPNGSNGHPWQFQVRFTAAAASARAGIAVSGYEYRKYQLGSAPAWLPLRFPGQYYDAETDLFQNWNRFYDATTGRYLEPEPMWLYPEKLVPLASLGRSVPIYAYAGNNPINSTDPTGLDPADVAYMQGFVDSFKNTMPEIAAAAGALVAALSQAAAGTAAAAAAVGVATVSGAVFVGAVLIPSNIAQDCSPECRTSTATIQQQGSGTSSPPLVPPATSDANKPKDAPSYPGDDATKPPADGWSWRGPDQAGGKRGAWVSPDGSESLHPDLDHPAPQGPHWDWNDSSGGRWRIYPDGTVTPKR